MIKIQCQHCKNYLDFFHSNCSYCQKPLLGATAIDLLGQCTIENIKNMLENKDVKQAKKKATLYLKLCEKFLCDVELAFLRFCTSKINKDSITKEAISDVRLSHERHISNLEAIIESIAQGGAEELEAVKKNLENISVRMKTSLDIWLQRVCED